MKISVRIKPNAREARVVNDGDNFIAYVKEPPIENKANLALIDLLAKYFGKPKSHILISHGLKSKNKVIEIK